jgi:hypothetical protein
MVDSTPALENATMRATSDAASRAVCRQSEEHAARRAPKKAGEIFYE